VDLTAKGTRKLELTANRGGASLAGILGRGPKGEDGSNVLPTNAVIAAFWAPVDNGDGTYDIPTGLAADNGDGTYTIGAA